MAHVTVPVTTRRVTYTASAAVGPYAFNYTVFSEDDLAVTVDGVAKVLTVDYTVSLTGGFDGGYPGGTITFGSAQTGEVVIDGDTTMGRLTDFPNSGPLSMISLNTDLDKRAAVDQQLYRDIGDAADRIDDTEDRLDTVEADITAIEADIVAIEDDIDETVRVTPGENGMILPTRVTLANQFLGFNGAGEPVATSTPSVTVSTQAEFANAAALNAATVDPAVDWVRLAGRSTVGDPGQGLYKRRVGAPSHNAYHTSNAGSVYWELAEPVVTPEHLGAAGNGTADDTTPIGQWHTACSVLSRPGMATKGATYKVTTGQNILLSNIDIDWNGSTVNLVSAVNSTTALTYIVSTATHTKTITVNALLDSVTLTLNNVTSLTVGMYVDIDAAFATGTQSHMAKIIEIAGSVITLSSPLPFALLTADTYTLNVYATLLSNVKVRNLTVNGSSASGTSMGGVIFRQMNETCEVSNIRVTDFNTANTGGMSLQICYGTKVYHISSTRSGSNGAAALVLYHCSSLVVHNIDSDADNGFGFEALAGSHMQFFSPKVQGSDGRAFKFAGVTNSTVIGGEFNLDRGSGVGLAVTVRSQRNTFIGCRINGHQGSQSQGVWTSGLSDINNTFIGLHISGCSGGAFNNPIAIAGTDTGNRFIDCYVDLPSAISNNAGAIFINLNGYAAFDVNDSGITAGPVQTVHTHSATPANSDNLGLTEYTGVNASLVPIRYFAIAARLNTVTAGAERGAGVFSVVINGAVTEVAQVGDGNTFKPVANNVTTLGTSAQQWSDVYATQYTVGSNKVVGARQTGYVAWTGATNRSSALDPGTVTLATLAQRVSALQADLVLHGLIGP
jgi:aspartate 1-decarboxylase